MAIHRVLPLLFLMTLGAGCGENASDEKSRPDGSTPSSPTSPPPTDTGDETASKTTTTVPPTTTPGGGTTTPRTPCTPPDGVSNDPQDIADVVELLNAMPKPVSIACFVDVLKRPLHLNATASEISVQPAVSESLPRIFLFSGSSLLLTFVPAGDGSKAVELSYLFGSTSSLKAEIGFPVTGPLDPDAGYKRIVKATGGGSTCSGCHANERAAGGSYGPDAYISKALRPFPTRDVPLSKLKAKNDACAKETSEACDIVRSIFAHGDVLPQAFPTDMPTIF